MATVDAGSSDEMYGAEVADESAGNAILLGFDDSVERPEWRTAPEVLYLSAASGTLSATSSGEMAASDRLPSPAAANGKYRGSQSLLPMARGKSSSSVEAKESPANTKASSTLYEKSLGRLFSGKSNRRSSSVSPPASETLQSAGMPCKSASGGSTLSAAPSAGEVSKQGGGKLHDDGIRSIGGSGAASLNGNSPTKGSHFERGRSADNSQLSTMCAPSKVGGNLSEGSIEGTKGYCLYDRSGSTISQGSSVDGEFDFALLVVASPSSLAQLDVNSPGKPPKPQMLSNSPDAVAGRGKHPLRRGGHPITKDILASYTPGPSWPESGVQQMDPHQSLGQVPRPRPLPPGSLLDERLDPEQDPQMGQLSLRVSSCNQPRSSVSLPQENRMREPVAASGESPRVVSDQEAFSGDMSCCSQQAEASDVSVSSDGYGTQARQIPRAVTYDGNHSAASASDGQRKAVRVDTSGSIIRVASCPEGGQQPVLAHLPSSSPDWQGLASPGRPCVTLPSPGEAYLKEELLALSVLNPEDLVVRRALYVAVEQEDFSDVVRMLKEETTTLEQKFALAAGLRELMKVRPPHSNRRALFSEAGGLIPLVQMLDLEDPMIVEKVATALLNISLEEAQKEELLGIEGFLMKIVKLTEQGQANQLREVAAAILYSVSNTPERQGEVGDAGAVPNLLELLSSPTMTERGKKDAAHALFNLSRTGRGRGIIIFDGGISVMVKLMTADKMIVKGMEERLVAVLVNVVRAPGACDTLMQQNDFEELLETLAWLLDQGNVRAKEEATGVLHALALNSEQGRSEVWKGNRRQSIINLTGHSNNRLKQKARELRAICMGEGAVYPSSRSHE
eukprot:TRINITY_DN796_c0_g2_i6.p1 TRINITY_DN796_c0_g2~~TRINITY_DN796_c0_g2_i6.p1  ORF type:complete len:848 (+),score=105.24 TRINITY_DN796_c0_g2_i6:1279-3822(+)